MPERDPFHHRGDLGADHPRQSADPLRADRVLLMGHRRRAFLARAERLGTAGGPGALGRPPLASPQTRSERTGFFLWGIADEPFWPVPNGSASSATSVRWPCLTSSAIAMD